MMLCSFVENMNLRVSNSHRKTEEFEEDLFDINIDMFSDDSTIRSISMTFDWGKFRAGHIKCDGSIELPDKKSLKRGMAGSPAIE